jgi:deoxyribodipyrimidine photo-lyase
MNNLVWFRNDLRITDNSSLKSACNGERVIGVYFFDPRHYALSAFGFKKTGQYRAQFLLETVAVLKKELQKLNIPLFVYQAKPEDILPELLREHNINAVFYQEEWTSEEALVANAVRRKVPREVTFHSSYDQFLFHPNDIPYNEIIELPQVFTQFRKKCEKYTKVRATIEKPSPLENANLLENNTQLPNLADLGLNQFEKDQRSAFPFSGGEISSMSRIQDYFWTTKKLQYYKKTRNGLLGVDYSAKLSPWLANGSISARTIYWEVKRFEKEVQKNQDTYWLIFELIWRDFFKYVSLKHGNAIFQQGGILRKEYDWKQSKVALEKWTQGNTPEPFVNANMKELALTGWMSNRGRQNVASFWAKEWQEDWRYGAAYFESLLLDYDVHSNWCNWMYNSGVGNDPRDRKFNIARQAQLYDAHGKYQRLWLQETLF